MYMKLMLPLLLLEIIDIAYTVSEKDKELIKNICDGLHDKNNIQTDEDKQWEIICQEFSHPNDDNKLTPELYDPTDENIPPNKMMRKVAVRGSRITGGSRTSIRGIRPSPSGTTYRNTHTGIRIHRPNGWQWSRSRLVFLPLATRFGHRSRSSSNRFTTPSTSSATYYYCTSNSDPSEEIQCSSTDGDSQCCEVESTLQPFCCGGSIPDEYDEDPNRATETVARIFYTLAALAFCMHLLMRRLYR